MKKSRVLVFNNGLSDFAHQSQHIVNIVDGQTVEVLEPKQDIMASSHLQMSANGLFGCNVVHVCSREPKTTLVSWTTASAGTALLNWTEVIGE